MVKQQFLGGLTDFGLSILTLSSASNDGSALKSWSATIEDEDRLGTQVQELANPSKEPKQMSVPYHISLLVPHRLHELYHPYTRICPQRKKKKNSQILKERESLIP